MAKRTDIVPSSCKDGYRDWTHCIGHNFVSGARQSAKSNLRCRALCERSLCHQNEHLSSFLFLVGFMLLNVQFSMYFFVDRNCLSFFFWSLYCLFFLDLRLLITQLVSQILVFFFQQIGGIHPMDINYVPLPDDLFLYSYEA